MERIQKNIFKKGRSWLPVLRAFGPVIISWNEERKDLKVVKIAINIVLSLTILKK